MAEDAVRLRKVALEPVPDTENDTLQPGLVRPGAGLSDSPDVVSPSLDGLGKEVMTM
jgi:hypothetical protein